MDRLKRWASGEPLEADGKRSILARPAEFPEGAATMGAAPEPRPYELPVDPAEEPVLGELRFLYNVPGGRQLAAAARAAGAQWRGTEKPGTTFRESYDDSMRRHDAAVNSRAEVPFDPLLTAAATGPQMVMGPAAQAAWAGLTGWSRGDSAGSIALDSALNALPGGHGPSGPVIVDGMGMAAPIAVHASPNKWAGRPLDSARGTGEGGAAYGEGHYATVPSNSAGIDRRYRKEAIGSVAEGPPATGSTADQLRQVYEHGKMNDPVDRGTMYDYIRSQKPVRFQTDSLDYTIAEFADGSRIIIPDGTFAPEFTGPASGGSFHVWDVPDALLDYDASLGKQPNGPTVAKAMARPNELLRPAQEVQAELVARARSAGLAEDADILAGLDPKDLTIRDFWDMARNLGVPHGDLISSGSSDAIGRMTGARALEYLGPDALRSHGVGGHTYAGEAGSARTSGIEGDVPNFVIYRGEDIKPLGTFGSAEEWLASDLRKQLQPRIDAEDALRKAGQATPEAYAELRRRFGGSP